MMFTNCLELCLAHGNWQVAIVIWFSKQFQSRWENNLLFLSKDFLLKCFGAEMYGNANINLEIYKGSMLLCVGPYISSLIHLVQDNWDLQSKHQMPESYAQG